MSHWPPRVGDRVWSSSRTKLGMVAEGAIVCVDKNDFDDGMEDENTGEIMVQYDTVPKFQHARYILLCDGRVHWDTRWPEFRLGWPHKWTYALVGGETCGSGDVETLSFEELDGNWSPHDIGDGSWSIG